MCWLHWQRVLHWTAVQKSLSSPGSRRFIDKMVQSSPNIFSPYFYSTNIKCPNLSYITYSFMSISVLNNQPRCCSKMSLVIFITKATTVQIISFLHCVCSSPTSFVIQGRKWYTRDQVCYRPLKAIAGQSLPLGLLISSLKAKQLNNYYI